MGSHGGGVSGRQMEPTQKGWGRSLLSSLPTSALAQGPPGFPGKAGAPGPPGPQAEKVSRTPPLPKPGSPVAGQETHSGVHCCQAVITNGWLQGWSQTLS